MTPFESILLQSSHPQGPALLLLLAWIAQCDDDIDEAELESLRRVAEVSNNSPFLSAITELAQSSSVSDLCLACDVLRNLDPASRRNIMQMSIGMGLEDGILTTSEVHILRFVADLLEFDVRGLDSLFQEITGSPFPPASDLSQIDWWHQTEHRNRRQQGKEADPDRGGRAHATESVDMGIGRLRDLAILGLDEQATSDAIRIAYRRLALIHHPDRFVSLGEAAVAAAEVSFRRIQAAYERLT